MHESLKQLDHRPWPLPETRWNWRQAWLDLAFVHFRARNESILPLLPDGVKLQKFDGSPWVGLVPFGMAGVMRRSLPGFLQLPPFPELNLRTYVEVDGKPGVWFFSLDADSRILVFGGRHFYGLPYHLAKMQQNWQNGWCEFSSRRRTGPECFHGRYRPVGEVFFARPGSFEHWATERYCLFSHTERRGIVCAEVHHAPWPLQKAEVEIHESSIISNSGILLAGEPPVCHFSTGVQVVSFPAKSLKRHEPVFAKRLNA